MRLLKLAAGAAAVGAVVCTTAAQDVNTHENDNGGYKTPTAPVGQFKPLLIDTGPLANGAEAPSVLFSELITEADANWIRLYFGEVTLEPGSFVRVTSMHDGEVQVLDAGAMEIWNNSTAYFNGSSVLFEVVGGAETTGSRVVLEQIAFEPGGAEVGQCGICGADNRVSSSEEWTARLFPAGCTASVYNESSCMVTAGHCVGGNMVVQFNVPLSNPNCSTNNPPVADQFPASVVGFLNGGVGNDWGVLEAGTNNLGETPYERYNVLRPIAGAPASNGDTVTVWGYGVDSQCTLSQTQQTHTNTICAVLSNRYTFNVDITGGNSGSALMHNDEIIGIVTHCPCCNIATRIDLGALETTIDLCPAADPVPIATGQNSQDDGFLLVSTDAYGSWSTDSPNLGDLYNPAGGELPSSPAFTAGFYLFVDGTRRELLSTDGTWLGILGADNSLISEITGDLVGSDTDGDSVIDTTISSFQVGGGPVLLSCDLVQHVESVTVVATGTPAALLTQEYTFTNLAGEPVDFTLVRAYDGDLVWAGDFSDDSVGTGTNSLPAERFVYMQEPGDPATGITVSSPGGTSYVGGKHGVDPDGGGPAPAYGFGTDTHYWDAFGIPTGWDNHVAGVGYDTDGDSGAFPPGSSTPFDGHIALEIPVSLAAGPGPGSTVSVVVHHTYGATQPLVPAAPCPWDCEVDPDGSVGINDFLELLAQWSGPGSCDFDGGGVGINDFLELLSFWGDCP